MVVIPIKFYKHLLHWRPDLQQQGKDDEQRLPEQTLYLVFYTWPHFYEMKIWKVSFASPSPCLSTSSTPHYSRHCHHITHPHCSWRPAGRSQCRSRCAGSPALPRGTWRSPPAAWSPPGFQSFPMTELKINLVIIAMIIQINNQSLATSLPENLPLKRRQSWKSSKQLDKKTCTDSLICIC